MDPDQVPNTYLSYGTKCSAIDAYDLSTCVSSRTSLAFDNIVPQGFASVEFVNGTNRVLAFGDVTTVSSTDVLSQPITVEIAGLLPDQPSGNGPDTFILDTYAWSKATSLLHLTGNMAGSPQVVLTQ